jgi:hypothetical protein
LQIGHEGRFVAVADEISRKRLDGIGDGIGFRHEHGVPDAVRHSKIVHQAGIIVRGGDRGGGAVDSFQLEEERVAQDGF